jgi:hypothetical protein
MDFLILEAMSPINNIITLDLDGSKSSIVPHPTGGEALYYPSAGRTSVLEEPQHPKF